MQDQNSYPIDSNELLVAMGKEPEPRETEEYEEVDEVALWLTEEELTFLIKQTRKRCQSLLHFMKKFDPDLEHEHKTRAEETYNQLNRLRERMITLRRSEFPEDKLGS